MHSSESRLHQWLRQHRLAAFVLMTFSFVLFGALSLDLVKLVAANAGLIAAHGWQALQDGGAQQLLELWLTAFAAIAAYLLFKLCEHVLVQALSQRGQPHGRAQ